MIVSLVFLTWTPEVGHERSQYAERCLESAIRQIHSEEHEIRVHIADDGSPKEHRHRLIEICKNFDVVPTVSNSDRGGYGKNFNLAMQVTHQFSDYILPLEDDWDLKRNMYLDPLIDSLERSHLRCIRLGYLGFTREILGTVIKAGEYTYLELDPSSTEPHIFTGHPRLEKVSYEKAVGPWPEGLAAGETEWIVAGRKESRIGVAWPLDMRIPASQMYGSLFAHIGSVGVGEVNPVG